MPDYTKELNTLLTKNIVKAEVVNHSTIPAVSNSYFYMKVKSGGAWDYKIKDNWERDLDVPYLGNRGLFMYNGKLTTAEDFGNINYGYVGSAMGYLPTILYMGGGYAKCGITVKIMDSPYHCDDENDHEMIKRGIDMYYGLDD